MERTCSKCGGSLEAGFTTAHGLIGDPMERGRPRLRFVIPSATPTSPNPVRAFQQGLTTCEPAQRDYGIRGFRCTSCGALELYADA